MEELKLYLKTEKLGQEKYSEYLLQCPTPSCIQNSLQGKESTVWGGYPQIASLLLKLGRKLRLRIQKIRNT